MLATVHDFAARAGAERVVVLLDSDPPLVVERLEDGTMQVTEGEATRRRGAGARRGARCPCRTCARCRRAR